MLELDGVTVRFGDVVAVREVSLTVAEGELLMLLGGSGSGKTTTLETINRLVEPTEGTVRLRGEDVRALVPHELRRRIGYCFQGTGLFAHLTVAENVGITPRLLGWPPERVAARVAELLELVELPAELAARLPDQLSGGQAQRVGVARALAAEPELVLFDEPFGALDPITRESLQASFTRVRRETGLTGVFVTHDVIEALTLGDRVAVLRDGALVALGTAAALRESDDPYVRKLLDAPRRALGALA
ncbi:MAG: ATP-binding cassette domain-containing protein [Sandaracinaceae bacterium]|nr:ATP-binding cassette domain-containing protein [Sandaracinaceae bacterium]